MKSTRGPLVLAVFGAVLALAGGVAAVVASSEASAASGGRFPLGSGEGLPPGSVAALVLLVGLLLVGIGAAVHDGRELRRPPQRGATHPVLRSLPRPAPHHVGPRRAATRTHLHLVGGARRT